MPQKWKVLWDKLELPITDSLTVSSIDNTEPQHKTVLMLMKISYHKIFCCKNDCNVTKFLMNCITVHLNLTLTQLNVKKNFTYPIFQ